MEKGIAAMEQASSTKKGGKRKIAIQLIENVDARNVCFSKRRTGLFKKASELRVMCGAQVRVVAFSPAGKPFYNFRPSSEPASNNEVPLADSKLTNLGRQVCELRAKIEASKRRNESLKARREEMMKESVWNIDVANADLTRLMAAKKALEEVRVQTLSPGEMSLKDMVALLSS
ncbi:Agamous-like MADS-box protein AGL61 [Rhynchospora pubera]|uniref:Agamous-like MADS-box protein AGL61 n=1 Tax=Rhynchospora pubera TaxID=906938 RepID=A0AAV8D0H7_9POAL|nr:Agamous-like MADS-box protein AGL61 [Rhynchospora pubera]